MNTIITLILLTHPIAMSNAIDLYKEGASIDDAASEVITAIHTDDTFNEYSPAELQAAISEAITEY